MIIGQKNPENVMYFEIVCWKDKSGENHNLHRGESYRERQVLWSLNFMINKYMTSPLG